MKSFFKLLCLFLCLSSLSAANGESYEKWLKKHQASFSEFKSDYLGRYNAFKEKVEKEWGDKTVLSSRYQYVLYTKNLKQRMILDYKKNQIILESLDGSKPDVKESLKALQNTSVGQALKADPVLSNMSSTNDSTSLLKSLSSSDSVSDYEHQSEQSEANVDDFDESGPNAKTQKKVNTEIIQLPNSAMAKRVTLFLPYASKMSERYDIDRALILAVTQTESSFNPLAQSPIPAFGLMQVVPDSAGLDVNQVLYKKNESPTPSTLFQPQDNLRFGAGYLHLLNSQYFKSIENEQSRLYCIIAAYNTGAGNVASVFHPDHLKVLSPAINVINTLSAQEVYDRLEKDLPYNETKIYLERVTKAIKQYESL